MEMFTLRAYLKTPIIKRGFMTLDALLMSILGKGDVSDLLRCDEGLYFASAGFPVDSVSDKFRASFVASLRPEHTPEWLEVIKTNTRSDDLQIGLARQRDAGNIINSYPTQVATAIEWYATGQMLDVLDIVKDIVAIGKRRVVGYGEVKLWEAELGEIDGLVGFADEPLRPVPTVRWHLSHDFVPVEAAWKAPYWDVRNRTKCFVPEIDL
jgi:hypothetical protein